MARYKALEKYLRNLGYDPAEIIRPGRDPVSAYKLFRQRDGELYPLFVNADQPVPVGSWLEAETGPLTDAGKVQSKIGALAYRPGWHAGDLPIATHIGGKATEFGKIPTKPNYRPDEQVWAEIEMADDVDWQRLAMDRAERSKAGNLIPRTAHITDRLPTGGHYRYKTNPNMTGEWLIGGDMRVNRILEDAEVREINRAAGVEDLPRLRNLQRRKGYVPAAAGAAVGLGALSDAEEAEAGPITAAIRADWGLADDALERAAEQGFDLSEVLWHGGRKGGYDRFEPGRVGSTFFTPDYDYASSYGTPYPYVIKPGRQLDMYNNPEHERLVADAFNRRGGWRMADEENYLFDEDQLAARGANPYEYKPGLDQQWEMLDEPENDVISELWGDYDTFRFGEGDTQAVMVPGDELESRVKRLDAKFRGPGLLGGAAGAGVLASGQEAQAGSLEETADDPGLAQVMGSYLLDRAGGAVNAAMTPLRGLRGLYELALTGDINAAAGATQPGFENNMNSLEVLDLPLRGLLGLAAGGDINRMADIARQDSDQTLFDFGGWVTDLASQNQTLRPFASALGTAAYTVPTFLSPI